VDELGMRMISGEEQPKPRENSSSLFISPFILDDLPGLADDDDDDDDVYT
jgi:hypothetical protein